MYLNILIPSAVYIDDIVLSKALYIFFLIMCCVWDSLTLAYSLPAHIRVRESRESWLEWMCRACVLRPTRSYFDVFTCDLVGLNLAFNSVHCA
jgi:hypothetical protein